jgi:hypothetical protein
MACLILSLCYIPHIFEAVLAYVHFACFCGLIIINIFIKDAEEGKGNRTKASRIMWLSKYFLNQSHVYHQRRSVDCRSYWRGKSVAMKSLTECLAESSLGKFT